MGNLERRQGESQGKPNENSGHKPRKGQQRPRGATQWGQGGAVPLKALEGLSWQSQLCPEVPLKLQFVSEAVYEFSWGP